MAGRVRDLPLWCIVQADGDRVCLASRGPMPIQYWTSSPTLRQIILGRIGTSSASWRTGIFVTVQSNEVLDPGDIGSAVIDIFRLETGRIVEHWDIVQAIPTESANTNSMF
jgi:hypothetical protein